MAHQVLARKWRPRTFEALVGQDHVVRALSHALETGRLHHAYLFTGTRGVGKTTIARILAKAVNCQEGMSATPCGKCGACTQIDGGGFVDYLELDAASNRGVDDMVQILDNAVYAPTEGRYKVYVIDEVHMLTAHAFNAMLKTLEEPPPHMLFILATTDPQKVPVTVLSRCMQLNLRNMRPSAIAEHLKAVLAAEQIDADESSLELIGRCAGGSMRDALSLVDQAIAAGAGQVSEAQVRDMLGMIDAQFIERILQALVASDSVAMVALADEIAEQNGPAERLLADLAERFAELAVVAATGDAGRPGALTDAAAFSPTDLQVFYQIAVHGQKDLALAPDVRSGLMMTLLRMLAFAGMPQTSATASGSGGGGAPNSDKGLSPVAAARAALAGTGGSKSVTGRAGAGVVVAPSRTGARANAGAALATGRIAPRQIIASTPAEQPESAVKPEPDIEAQLGPEPAAPEEFLTAARQAGDVRAPEASPPATQAAAINFDGDWPALARRAGLSGRTGQFMTQSQLVSRDDRQIVLRVPIAQLAEASLVQRVQHLLAQELGALKLIVQVGQIDGHTAAKEFQVERDQELAKARAALDADPFVRTLISDFHATIVPDSVRPIGGSPDAPRC